MSGTERKVERQRRGKGADRVSPEAQWSGVEINSPSLRSLGERKSGQFSFTKLASIARRGTSGRGWLINQWDTSIFLHNNLLLFSGGGHIPVKA
jgi:hypothetical protein